MFLVQVRMYIALTGWTTCDWLPGASVAGFIAECRGDVDATLQYLQTRPLHMHRCVEWKGFGLNDVQRMLILRLIDQTGLRKQVNGGLLSLELPVPCPSAPPRLEVRSHPFHSQVFEGGPSRQGVAGDGQIELS